MKDEHHIKRYIYLFRTFLLIGSTSFGGYMSLIAMMRNRMVVRDKAVTDDLITEGISLASMLPGPLAVNVVTYVGFCVAGIAGALVSMTAVLLPSFLLVLALTWVYLHAGSAVEIDDVLKGIFPIVAGIILATGVSMGKKICTRVQHIVIAGASFVAVYFLGSYWAILAALAVSAIAGMLLFEPGVEPRSASAHPWQRVVAWLGLFALGLASIIWLSSATLLGKIFEEFSVVSLSLFGGGYVMIPLLKSLLVDQLAWITDQEFVYGISVGQVTPGPILISATFFGYKIAGLPGAVVATVAIFTPSAILMLLMSAIFDALKHSKLVQAALSGVKPCVVGLVLYSGLSMLLTNMHGTLPVATLSLAAASFFLVFRYNVSNVMLILAGGAIGFLLY